MTEYVLDDYGYRITKTEAKKRAKLVAEAESWNTKNPEGTKVRYKSVMQKEYPWKYTRTRSLAWVLGHHTVVVMLESESGGWCLAHVEVATDEQWEANEKRKNRECVEL